MQNNKNAKQQKCKTTKNALNNKKCFKQQKML